MKFCLSIFLFFFVFNKSSAGIREELKVSLKDLTPASCVKKMNQVESTFSKLKASDYVEQFTNGNPEELGQEIWVFKIKVHNELRSFFKQQDLTKECANAFRGALRAVRFTEDLIEDHKWRNNTAGISFPSTAFTSRNPQLKTAPEFANFNPLKDLKSGDVILTRGNAYTSSAIASLGEFDTQFSHMSLIYIDSNQKTWAIEAHIEVGSFVRTLEDHIKDNNFRTMIFRFDDHKLAAKAADYIFHKVKKASDTVGNIFYDFGFDMSESEKLFCSEIVSHSFDFASDGKVKLPLFTSKLQSRKPSFVQNIGIKALESFIPADIEIDPRFKVVAEWRDAARVVDSHEKDAVLHSIYDWADDYEYRMIQGSSRKSFIYRNVAWPLRRVPVLKKYFKNKLPINMSRKLIGYFGVLESMAELLHKDLSSANKKVISERGVPLMREESASHLEEFRLNDIGARKKKLHKMYRPITSKEQKESEPKD